MKKIGIILLSIFMISNIGFSKIIDSPAVLYDDKIFGEKKYCDLLGTYFILTSTTTLKIEMLGKESLEVKKSIAKVKLVGEELNMVLIKEGYDYSDSFIDNFKYYYQNNCRIPNRSEFSIKNYTGTRIIDYFYVFMNFFIRKN